jgi:hypothetical protein
MIRRRALPRHPPAFRRRSQAPPDTAWPRLFGASTREQNSSPRRAATALNQRPRSPPSQRLPESTLLALTGHRIPIDLRGRTPDAVFSTECRPYHPVARAVLKPTARPKRDRPAPLRSTGHAAMRQERALRYHHLLPVRTKTGSSAHLRSEFSMKRAGCLGAVPEEVGSFGQRCRDNDIALSMSSKETPTTTPSARRPSPRSRRSSPATTPGPPAASCGAPSSTTSRRSSTAKGATRHSNTSPRTSTRKPIPLNRENEAA